MFITTEQRAAQTAVATLDRLGVERPAQIAKAAKAQEEDAAGMAALLAKGDTLRELGAARGRGEDVDSTALLDALLGATLASTGQTDDLKRDGASAVYEAVRADVDAIIEAVRPVFDEAAATIAAARAALGDVDLADLTAVAGIGGDAAEHWKRATAAERTVEQIKQLTGTLRQARAYPGTNDPREQHLAVVDVDLEGYKHIDRGTSVWQASGVGTLSLATPDEYTARLARINEQWGADPQNPATRIGPGVGQFSPTRSEAHVIGGAL